MQEVWWKRGIIYQIYPRSFQDSNADGVGDLNGIRARLDYLTWLGIDAIWISPIYPSPMADFGYDVSDYCDIDPRFGTLADFDALVSEAHARGLKVILDYVPNHTSERHPWFLESRSSRSSAKRDWYIWRDPAPDGGPPNNWFSQFGGSAWEFDAPTGQYYLHSFLKEQPDLDWRNPQVAEAMHDVMRFWLDRGIDGFRVDALHHVMKDALLRDNPPNPAYREGEPDAERLLQLYSLDQPDVHEMVAGLRKVIDAYDDRVLIGEIYLPIERLVAYYGKDLSGTHLPFNFQLIRTAWKAPALRALVEEYEAALPPGGWPNWVLGNHDRPRVATRVGHEQARIAAMLLLTLRGTPTMYYGDEIGMADVEIPPESIQDPWAINEAGLGVGRDPQRTPMQWDGGPNGGFSSAKPWLPLSPDYPRLSVAAQRDDPLSLLSLYRRLIALRRAHPALSIGSFHLLPGAEDVLAYERVHRGERFFVLLNLGRAPRTIALPEAAAEARIELSSHADRHGERAGAMLSLRPNEGVVLRKS